MTINTKTITIVTIVGFVACGKHVILGAGYTLPSRVIYWSGARFGYEVMPAASGRIARRPVPVLPTPNDASRSINRNSWLACRFIRQRAMVLPVLADNVQPGRLTAQAIRVTSFPAASRQLPPDYSGNLRERFNSSKTVHGSNTVRSDGSSLEGNPPAKFAGPDARR
jgi:hypothetical protein